MCHVLLDDPELARGLRRHEVYVRSVYLSSLVLISSQQKFGAMDQKV